MSHIESDESKSIHWPTGADNILDFNFTFWAFGFKTSFLEVEYFFQSDVTTVRDTLYSPSFKYLCHSTTASQSSFIQSPKSQRNFEMFESLTVDFVASNQIRAGAYSEFWFILKFTSNSFFTASM